jgi:hypothetical protein
LDEKWEPALAGLAVDRVAGEEVVVAADMAEALLEVVWAAAVWGEEVAAAVPSAWEPPPIGAII